MLRAKQIGTFSNTARSLFLASSRSTADGAPCGCPEDENYAGRKSTKNTESLLNQKKSNLVYSIAAKPGSSNFKDVIKSASHHSSEGLSQAPTTHVLSPKSPTRAARPNCLYGRAGGVKPMSDVDSVNQNLSHPATLVGKQFTKAGVFSDVVDNGLTTTANRSPLRSQMGNADATTSASNLRSSKNSYQWGSKKGQRGRSDIAGERKNYSSQPDENSGKTGRSGERKVKQTVSGGLSGPCVNAAIQKPDSQDGICPMPQSTAGHSNAFFPEEFPGETPPEEKVVASISENASHVEKPQRPTRSAKRRENTKSFRLSGNGGKPIEVFLGTLHQQKWGAAAEEALGNLHCKLDPFQANQVLKSLQDHSVALGFFNWLRYQPGFKHDEHTYTTMVGILGRARQFGSIRKLLEDMGRDGCKPNVVTYNRLIHGYGRANHIDEAMKVFYQMQAAGCQPDHVTFSTLIDIHAKAGYLDIAMDLYQKMLEGGLCPDTFTYSVMINCLGKAGHLPAAHELFCEMIERGCVPNLVTYNIMIALQAKARNYPSALKLYRSMQSAGFCPDKVTYSIVMEVLGHCGRLDEVEALFTQMKQECPPDEPVYGLLVDLWGKAGKVDKARYWYQTMLDSGLRPNVPTCNSLLSAFLRVNRFSDAYYVLQNMLQIGLYPSLQTYTLLLSSCTEMHGNMTLCCELMATTGHPAHTFLSTLPAAEPGGQNVRDHTCAFLDLMHSEDRESKRGLVDAVVDFLHKSGLKEEAGMVWEVASHRNVYPDAIRRKGSSYWLINLHVMSEGTAITVVSRTLAWFRRQILESGVRPDRIDIVTGWGRRSRVTGSSLVRQAVGDLLHLFRSPFYSESRNSGCFVGSGGSLHSWLLQSYVERMHLL